MTRSASAPTLAGRTSKVKQLVRDTVKADQNEVYGGSDALYPTTKEYHAVESALARISQVKRENVLVTCGGSEAIAVATTVLKDDGPMIIADTTFPLFWKRAELENQCIVKVPVLADGHHDLASMLACAQKNAEKPIVVVVDPNNPTGTAVGKESLLMFAKKLPKYATMILDRAYAGFAHNPATVREVLDAHPKSIIIETSSKTYGAAGLRIGAAITEDPELLERLKKRIYSFNVTMNSLKRYAELLDDGVAHAALIYRNKKSRAQFIEAGWDIYPTETNFVSPVVKESPDVVLAKLKLQGIEVRSGTGFGPGMENRIRVSFGTPEQNKLIIRTVAPYVRLAATTA